MGKGSEGDAEVNERLHGQSTEPARDFYRLAEEHDEASRTAQRRRAGNRFRYRRRRTAAHNVRTVDDAPFYEYVSAALRRTLVLVCVQITLGTFASGPDTGSDRTLARTAVVQMSYISSSISYLHTSPHGSSADALRSATFDLTTVNTDSRYAYATICYDRPRLASARSCWQLQQNRSDVHLQPLPMNYAYQRPRLLVTAPPIANSRPQARLHRTDSSCFPASPRPAASPACRPSCPGRPAWTRPPLSRSAQRLHTSKPCHSVPDGTPCTFQKYREKNSEKKNPIHRSNNVLQEPGGGIRARHTWHQLWPRANPVYVFLVPQPLLPASGRTSSDSPAERQVCHQPSKPALHYAPSSISELGSGTPSGVTVYALDLGSAALGRISSASLPAERQVCHQPSKPALHYAPSSISELGSGTPSGVTVYALDLGSAALGRISSASLPAEGQVCHQPSKSALLYAPSSISELGSGTLSGVTVYALDLGSATLGRISSDFLPAERQVCHQPSKIALHYAPSSTSELGSGTLSEVTVHAPDLGPAASGRISSDSLPAARQVRHQPSKSALHYAPSSISELGSGTLSGVTVYALDLGSATLGRISSDFLPAERQVCHQPSKIALHYAPPSISELSSPAEALRSLDAHVLGLETVTAPQAPPGMSAATELTPTPCSILPIAGQGHARPPDIPHA